MPPKTPLIPISIIFILAQFTEWNKSARSLYQVRLFARSKGADLRFADVNGKYDYSAKTALIWSPNPSIPKLLYYGKYNNILMQNNRGDLYE
ncbi:MAG: hypothetical protein ACE5J3_07475 [Methanosarcinales archaeon]